MDVELSWNGGANWTNSVVTPTLGDEHDRR